MYRRDYAAGIMYRRDYAAGIMYCRDYVPPGLCLYVCMTLKQVRCSIDMSSVLSRQVSDKVFRIPEGITHTPLDTHMRRHLTWTNACAERLNDLIMRQEIRRQRKVLWYLDRTGAKINVSTGVRNVPDGAVCVTRGTPVTLKSSCSYGARNSTHIVGSFTATSITLHSEGASRTHDLSPEFFDTALPAYATTIHKSQGSTIAVPYQVHEIERFANSKLGPKLIYVALTRCTKPAYVHICQNCCCHSMSITHLTRKVCAYVRE